MIKSRLLILFVSMLSFLCASVFANSAIVNDGIKAPVECQVKSIVQNDVLEYGAIEENVNYESLSVVFNDGYLKPDLRFHKNFEYVNHHDLYDNSMNDKFVIKPDRRCSLIWNYIDTIRPNKNSKSSLHNTHLYLRE